MEPNVQQPTSNEPVVHDFNKNFASFSIQNRRTYIVVGLALVLGLFSGFILSQNKGAVSTTTKTGFSSFQKGTIVGSEDTKTFKDQAEGIMKKGGTDGEGAYHLVRPGGESQNVYLTSSIVDLSLFLDKKVKVWGQTQKAQVAGWLMDVGRVEVLE